MHRSTKLLPHYPCLCSPTDDDYSDTYNATFALINSGEAFSSFNRVCASGIHFFSTHFWPPFCCHHQTICACRPTPPWPIHQHGLTPTDRCPRAPQTTEDSLGLGSHHHPLCLHRLHLCRPSSNCGPETATVRRMYQTCKLKLLTKNTLVYKSVRNENALVAAN